MTIRRFTKTVAVDASGDATAYIGPVKGKLVQIQYVKTDYADGVDFTITTETTAMTLWAEANVNAAAIRAPRQATHSTAGVAALYASGGVAVNDKIAIDSERIKIVVAQGGVSKTGAFVVTLED